MGQDIGVVDGKTCVSSVDEELASFGSDRTCLVRTSDYMRLGVSKWSAGMCIDQASHLPSQNQSRNMDGTIIDGRKATLGRLRKIRGSGGRGVEEEE